MRLLVYTFRTFPQIEELRSIFPEVYIFGSLKEDMKEFKELIQKEKPKYILGVATSENTSRLETFTVNRFGKDKKIEKEGVESFGLYVPEGAPFPSSANPTSSFCNWTMYKITEFLHSENLSTKLIFCHVAPCDVSALAKISQL